MGEDLLALYCRMRDWLWQDDGQDLIEYAMVVGLIAFAAVGGMGSVATAVNNAFGVVGNTLTASI